MKIVQIIPAVSRSVRMRWMYGAQVEDWMVDSIPTAVNIARSASESFTRKPSVARIVILKRPPAFLGYPASSSSWLARAGLDSLLMVVAGAPRSDGRERLPTLRARPD